MRLFKCTVSWFWLLFAVEVEGFVIYSFLGIVSPHHNLTNTLI